MKQTVNNKYSLHDTENFNKELTVTPNEVMVKYSDLLSEYTKFIIENIKIKNPNYSKFIIIRGLDTITHVFTTILYYTKNLDITYYHSQKSFYFYVEFISQISEAEKLFLQLSSRDAATYVYKKTLFDLNNNVLKQKCSNETKLKFDTIGEVIKIQKTILLNVLHGGKALVKVDAVEEFEELTKKINSLTFDLEKIIQLTRIIDVLYYKTDTMFLDLVTQLINKLFNYPEILGSLEQKINNEEFTNNSTDLF
jgi:hypothetical protein